MHHPRFAVAHPIPEAAIELLEEAGEVRVGEEVGPIGRERLVELAEGADALIAMLYDRIDGELVDAVGPRLRVVANVAVGHDNIALEELAERGVVVTNTPGVLTDATADLAIGLILMLTRRLGEGERLVRAREPWAWRLDFMLGSSLRGKRLGIVGLGEIGRATARRARAFGMEVVYHNRRRLPVEVEAGVGAAPVPLEELLESSDVVSLHCPLTSETRDLIDAAALARMKPTAYLVNTARGPVVDEAALVEALTEGEIAGAALDVFEHEPEVHPGLLERDDAVLVPHLGSATRETREAMTVLAARNAVAICSGRAAETPVGSLTRPERST